MALQTNFESLRGIRYYSHFKPTNPCEIAEGVFIVPSGWQFVPILRHLPSGMPLAFRDAFRLVR
jgi:hypothetical protein